MNTKLLAELSRWTSRKNIKATEAEELFGKLLMIMALREAGLTVSIPKVAPIIAPVAKTIEELLESFPINIHTIPALPESITSLNGVDHNKLMHLITERWIRARLSAGHFKQDNDFVSKISMIKAVRETLGLGLMDSKMWVEARKW